MPASARRLIQIKPTTTFAVEDILAMSQEQRKARVTRAEAQAHGLVFVDAVGGSALFVGTQREWEDRARAYAVRR